MPFIRGDGGGLDAMVKAKGRLVDENTGGGYVTAVIRGDVAAVKAAVDAGQTGAGAWARSLRRTLSRVRT